MMNRKMNNNFPSALNYSTLIKELDAGTLRPSYFFYGTEDVLIERALEKMKKVAVESGSEAFNWNVFRADDEVDWSAFADCLNSLSLLPSRRVVVLKNVGRISRLKKVIQLIETTIEQKPDDLILVLIDEEADSQKSIYQALHKHCAAVAFPTLSANEIKQYLTDFSVQFGKKITPTTMEKILAETDANLRELLSKLEVLFLYIGERESVQPEDVEECTVFTKELEIYRLLQALGQRDETMTRLSRELLLQKRVEIGSFISMLYRQIWAMYRMKYLEEQKVPTYKWQDLLSIRPAFLQKRYQNYLPNYSRSELGRSLEILAQADYLRKSSSMQDDFILSTLTENLLKP